ncbi:response regulator [Massilia sp. Dwa41.01b]|uniref:response regulator n=1 Tax=Massilia sp. Dwa41.01b TaxID=2709302 RepID=UPI0016028E46|nr:response regulator [Massilia sp. Dwa41.01b]
MATILIVDDRPSNRAYLLALLGFTEHRLLEAEDGAAALALVRAERPELIITDILMPTMDGYEFVQRLRADRNLAATRIIFYSAVYAERETIAMARSCGVRTVLSKPSDPQDILDAVNAELGMTDSATAPAAAAAARELAPFLPTPPVPEDSRVSVRLAALEEMLLHRWASARSRASSRPSARRPRPCSAPTASPCACSTATSAAYATCVPKASSAT